MILALLLAACQHPAIESSPPATPGTCSEPLIAECHGAAALPDAGGSLESTWFGAAADLAVIVATRDGCETASLYVEATGRAGTEQLLARLELTLAGEALSVASMEIEQSPGASGVDRYTNTWVDPDGVTRLTDFALTLESSDGWTLSGGLSGSVRGTGMMEGVLAELYGTFELLTVSPTVETDCP